MKFPKFWEHRSAVPSGSYTTDVLNYLSANASGQALRGVPAAVEVCAGAWARGMATAEISVRNSRTAVLTPSTLAYIGRYLLKYGEVIFEISVRRGQLTVTPAQFWRVDGGADRDTWTYELTMQGPNRYEVRTVPAGRVLHLTYATNHSAPWRGVGPLNEAGISQELLLAMEVALAQEANGPRGQVIPVPDTNQAGHLTTDLRNLRGGLSLVPSVASEAAWGGGIESKPADDWVSKRYGMMPPLAMVELRRNVELSILAAAGVSPAMLSQSDGTAMREGFRQFQMLTLQPVGKILAQQIADQLDVPGLAFSYNDLGGADLASRGRVFGQLVAGGVNIADAAEVAGLPIENTTPAPAPAPGATNDT